MDSPINLLNLNQIFLLGGCLYCGCGCGLYCCCWGCCCLYCCCGAGAGTGMDEVFLTYIVCKDQIFQMILKFTWLWFWNSFKTIVSYALYIKVYTKFNIATWLRFVKFTESNISEFWFFKFNYISYHWKISKKFDKNNFCSLGYIIASIFETPRKIIFSKSLDLILYTWAKLFLAATMDFETWSWR